MLSGDSPRAGLSMLQRVWQVFWRFLLLGCVSFGGPAAHIGYFQNQFVARLRWLGEEEFARLLALSQFLPGPGSSQLGFAIGLHRAGLAGACAAFLGFTLPSALLMYLLATWPGLAGAAEGAGVVHGLKLLAVVLVADATWQMASRFCGSAVTRGIALGGAMALLAFDGTWAQYAVLLTAATLGAWVLRERHPAVADTSGAGGLRMLPLSVFAALLLALMLLPAAAPASWRLLADFYLAGSLVFGGGHVVLPLLQEAVGSALLQGDFLTGYAAAQAVPGPMFSLAAYLGAQLQPGAPASGALIALAGIFLPGFLLLLGLQARWQALAARPAIAGAVSGINAVVVGLLLSALYDPVFVSAVLAPADMAAVLGGFLLLSVWRLPVAWLVPAFAAVGVLLA